MEFASVAQKHSVQSANSGTKTESVLSHTFDDTCKTETTLAVFERKLIIMRAFKGG